MKLGEPVFTAHILENAIRKMIEIGCSKGCPRADENAASRLMRITEIAIKALKDCGLDI